MSILDDARKEMDQAIDHLDHELKNLRTGRANPHLLNSVMVEVYGSAMRLQDVANVTVPEPRQLLVTPYDASNAGAIGKSIDKANLSVQVVVDSNVVRVMIPPMDEATRKEMVKQSKVRCEDGKVSIRNIRRKYNELARKQKTDSEVTEDQMHGNEKKIQTHTDEFCSKIDKLGAAKEKDILVI